jgi:hypothetical protein
LIEVYEVFIFLNDDFSKNKYKELFCFLNIEKKSDITLKIQEPTFSSKSTRISSDSCWHEEHTPRNILEQSDISRNDEFEVVSAYNIDQ